MRHLIFPAAVGAALGLATLVAQTQNAPAQQPKPTADPYANNPGHTQAFRVDEDPYGDGNTYRAGSAPAQPAGPRLRWKELLSGIVMLAVAAGTTLVSGWEIVDAFRRARRAQRRAIVPGAAPTAN